LIGQVEHIMREQNIMAAYDFIELYSELVVVRLHVIEKQRYILFIHKKDFASLGIDTCMCWRSALSIFLLSPVDQ
jgi:hypothetical protein